jgi:adenosine deaminase
MFDARVITTINSDDPAFFGGYLADNYQAAADAMGFSCAELVTCARYSFEASFLTAAEKTRCLQRLEEYAANHVCTPLMER